MHVKEKIMEAYKFSQSAPRGRMHDWFRFFANRSADWMGSPWSFLTAVAVIAVWGVSGPVFKFSDSWQLVINTSTTIVTFLMVFLIQNTQNRDARALHLKLDELIRAIKEADNDMIDLDCLSEEDLIALKERFESFSHNRHAEPSEPSRPESAACAEEQCGSNGKSTSTGSVEVEKRRAIGR
jgi:low affinity Fe/Cu permease